MTKYAGIGSRETPDEILCVMEDFAYAVASHSVLRSGGAPGADLAFEFGATLGGGLKEIFLPWKGFNDCINGCLLEPSQAARDLAEYYHPRWKSLSHGAKKLIARNSHQVLGKNLDDPVDMVVCWTKDGKASGGTGQAIRIAEARGIEVLNIRNPDPLEWVCEAIGSDGIPLS